MKNKDVRELLKSLPLIDTPDSLDQRVRISLAKLDLIEPTIKKPFFTLQRLLTTGAAIAVVLLGVIHLVPSESLQTPLVVASKLNTRQVEVFDTSDTINNVFNKENLTLSSIQIRRQNLKGSQGGQR